MIFPDLDSCELAASRNIVAFPSWKNFPSFWWWTVATNDKNWIVLATKKYFAVLSVSVFSGVKLVACMIFCVDSAQLVFPLLSNFPSHSCQFIIEPRFFEPPWRPIKALRQVRPYRLGKPRSLKIGAVGGASAVTVGVQHMHYLRGVRKLRCLHCMRCLAGKRKLHIQSLQRCGP